MRLVDADELMEHIGRDRVDSREAIMDMVKNAPTVINTRELRLKELECGQYSLECERLKGQVHALASAVRGWCFRERGDI